MTLEPDGLLADGSLPEIVRRIRARTPARLLAGRAGAAYRTETQMGLREAHAAARDAVRAEMELETAFGAEFIQKWQLFDVYTRARTKDEYLLHPDFGRNFDEASREKLRAFGCGGNDLQIVIGDGLSVPAVSAQVPDLLPLLREGAEARGWKVGRTFAIHHCRVGILNEIGALLEPQVAILLIGERPGLATAESLSAYMAYRPLATHSDANRNLISNIHSRGLSARAAASRILSLAAQMMKLRSSGYDVKEEKLLPDGDPS